LTAPSPFDPELRALTIGILMIVTVVAFQALGISTAMPEIARELDGLDAYGWAFSAFLLASPLGMVGAGQAADTGGPVRPFVAATIAFAAGSLLAGLAASWPMLVAGRALQGLGNGAVIALVYVSVARAYPPVLYGRMLAMLSTAWIVPSLIGPGLGGLVAEHAGWRWVFVMFLPLLPVCGGLMLAGLRTLERREPRQVDSRLWAALGLTLGLGAVLAALEAGSAPLAAALAAAGVAVGAPSFRRLLPAGTLRLRRGLPDTIAVRAMVSIGFLGADAFLPLALTRIHGFSLTQAGLVLSIGSLSWSFGSTLQARADRRDEGRGRPARVVIGAALLAAGLAVTTAGLIAPGVSPWVSVGGWILSGFGIGVTYPSIGAVALGHSPPGAEGSISASLQVIEAISVALFTGIGGTLLAAGLEHGWATTTAIGLVFGLTVLAAAAAVPAGRRVVAPV
jgi:MFS family permease